MNQDKQSKRLEQHAQEALDALLTMMEVLVSHDTEPDGEQATLTMTETARRLAELTCTVLGCRYATILGLEAELDVWQFMTSVGFSLEEEHEIRARIQGRSMSASLENPELISRLCAGEALVINLVQLPHRERQHSPDFTPGEMALATAAGKLAVLVIERKRLLLEKEEARANELDLRVAKHRMDEFLSIASHELRTPLTTIKGNVQLARLRLNSVTEDVGVENEALLSKLEEIKIMLERAERQVNVENRLVGDLLDVTRIQRNKLVMHKEECDLARIVREAVEEQRSSMASSRIILVDLAFSEDVPIIADAARIGQVVSNFLSNALKYSPSDRPIEVQMQVEGQKARVLVRDAGPGIPLEEQGRIWERFYRVPGVERRSGSSVGLGLGLYICRKIIEQHSGEIGVESTPGVGSTFWLALPLDEGDGK